MENLIPFRCNCKEAKTRRLVFDGGSTGEYSVEMCEKCYGNEDKKFFLREESISEVGSA